MSARRKGKPQQRKQLDTVEPEQDFVTCGNCQREFLFSDFVKFIQHKVNKCNKENVEPFDEHSFDSNRDNDNSLLSVNNARRTSISAPIALRGSSEPLRDKMLHRPSLQALVNDDDVDVDDHHEAAAAANGDDEVEDMAVDAPEQTAATGEQEKKVAAVAIVKKEKPGEDEDGRHRHRLPMVDAQCNTVNTEPKVIRCSQCRAEYGSSWCLIQHVQKSHDVTIYVDRRESSPPPVLHKAEPLERPPAAPVSAVIAATTSAAPTEKQPAPPDKELSSSNNLSSKPSSVHSTIVAGPAPPVLPLTPQILRPKASPTHSSPHSSGDSFTHSPPFLVAPRQPSSPAAAFVGHLPLSRPPICPEFPMPPDGMDPFRRVGPLPTSMEHALPGFPFRQDGFQGSALDYYSQRLRQLASQGPPSPPPQIPPPPQQQHSSPPSQKKIASAFQVAPSTPAFNQSPPPSQNKSVESKSMMPPQEKSCEVCGKCFRYQTILLLHRRSHTGEKPYDCPFCSYVCSHASKLRRHMITHTKSHASPLPSSRVSTASDNSMRSSASTPESKGSKMDEDAFGPENDDDDELDEDELLARETEAEDDISRMKVDMKRLFQQQEKERREQDNDDDDDDDDDELDDSKLDEDEDMDEDEDEENDDSLPNCKPPEEPTDLSLSKEQRAAILSEVMENTGLASIAQFKEAYKEALEESSGQRHERSRSADEVRPEISRNGLHNSEPNTPVRSSSNHMPGASYPNDCRAEHIAKKIKLESPEVNIGRSPPNHHHHQPHFPHLEPYYQRDAALFSSSIWFPPHGNPRELFNALTRNDHHHFLHRTFQDNGMHRESALDHGGPKPPHLNALPPVASASISGAIPGVPMRKRNDTCEFCGKIFKNCSNLTVHRRSHTGEKPYHCELCNYACAQSSKLTRHMKTHGRLGKDVYRCKFCNMPFSVPSTLEKHMRRCVENQNSRSLPMAATPNPDVSSPVSSASNA